MPSRIQEGGGQKPFSDASEYALQLTIESTLWIGSLQILLSSLSGQYHCSMNCLAGHAASVINAAYKERFIHEDLVPGQRDSCHAAIQVT